MVIGRGQHEADGWGQAAVQPCLKRVGWVPLWSYLGVNANDVGSRISISSIKCDFFPIHPESLDTHINYLSRTKGSTLDLGPQVALCARYSCLSTLIFKRRDTRKSIY